MLDWRGPAPRWTLDRRGGRLERCQGLTVPPCRQALTSWELDLGPAGPDPLRCAQAPVFPPCGPDELQVVASTGTGKLWVDLMCFVEPEAARSSHVADAATPSFEYVRVVLPARVAHGGDSAVVRTLAL